MEDRPFDLVTSFQGCCVSMSSALEVSFSASAIALSYESAPDPTEAKVPMSASRSVYRIDTYRDPRSL
ncbi:hypothetical protein WQO_03280 [Streptomyces globisporus C-1027]|uniref:Uncharacterized protein n=1 Tax=Streptomyces globisporus C-1027 TaxID=1172567 RepID=A0A0U3LAW1_STRGL|nr:hypothetical protein WQO_03280 [Streptomyces globisporus C-1027]OKJ20465.1 hypothetical protein AMK23_33115 [Streptomyces sp. CB02130]